MQRPSRPRYVSSSESEPEGPSRVRSPSNSKSRDRGYGDVLPTLPVYGKYRDRRQDGPQPHRDRSPAGAKEEPVYENMDVRRPRRPTSQEEPIFGVYTGPISAPGATKPFSSKPPEVPVHKKPPQKRPSLQTFTENDDRRKDLSEGRRKFFHEDAAGEDQGALYARPVKPPKSQKKNSDEVIYTDVRFAAPAISAGASAPAARPSSAQLENVPLTYDDSFEDSDSDYAEPPDEQSEQEEDDQTRAVRAGVQSVGVKKTGLASENRFGFLNNLLTAPNFEFMWSCLTEDSRKALADINACAPMSAHVLAALVQPVINREHLKLAGVAGPVLKVLTLMNYYYKGMTMASVMVKNFENIVATIPMDYIRQSVGNLARTRTGLSLVARIVGRRNVDNDQIEVCLQGLDKFLGGNRSERTDVIPSDGFARQVKQHNDIYRVGKFVCSSGCAFYRHNVEIFARDVQGSDFRFLCTEQNATADVQVASDVSCLLALAHASSEFQRSLATLKLLILHELQRLVYLFYLIYVQCPDLARCYERVVREITVQLEAPSHDHQSMRLVAAQLVKFVRQCDDVGVFASPGFVDFAIGSSVDRPAKNRAPQTVKVNRAVELLGRKELFVSSGPSGKDPLTLPVVVSKLRTPQPRSRHIPFDTLLLEDLSAMVKELTRRSCLMTGAEYAERCTAENRKKTSGLASVFRKGKSKK
uniref:Tegument protein UL25 n=1 Tax=Cardioderma bat herpesvirus TaxID=3141914 RepID=A0AAU7E1B4_9VIRU